MCMETLVEPFPFSRVGPGQSKGGGPELGFSGKPAMLIRWADKQSIIVPEHG